jgi:glyceraldehyde 3-phosphate dehydrogenase
MVSLNQMIDLHQSRVSVALDFRIVPSVWRTLYLVAMLTLITTGYQAGRGGARQGGGAGSSRTQGRLDGVSIRVPTPNVSVIDLKVVTKRATNVEEVNGAIERAAHQELKGILDYTREPNVSADFNHDPHSSNFAMDQTKVIDGNLVRVLAWYDNEWGFSNRMCDTAVAMGKQL